MKSVEYQQIWEMQDYILDMDNTVERVWDDHAQIQWLIDQGYEPKIQQMYDAASETVTFTMQFLIKPEDLTFLLIKWPQTRNCQEI